MSPDGAARSALEPVRMPPPPGSRSSEEIRRDIVRQREELGRSVGALRGRVAEITDVRRQIREHRTQILAGVAIAGFIIGGVVAFRRRRA